MIMQSYMPYEKLKKLDSIKDGVWKYYGIIYDKKRKKKWVFWTNSNKQYRDLKFSRGRYNGYKILRSNK